MIQRTLKIQKPDLHVAHQSEVLRLQKQLVEMEARLNALQKHQEDTSLKMTKSIPNTSRIPLPVDGGYQFVNLEDILYCEACGNYSRVFLINQDDKTQSILLSKTLKSTQQLIGNTKTFIRCHQSYLINKNCVKYFNQKDGLCVRLSNDKMIPVSRRNKKLVMNACLSTHL